MAAIYARKPQQHPVPNRIAKDGFAEMVLFSANHENKHGT